MTLDEIRLCRLLNQHLLSPTDAQTVVKDLCGLQAQFLSHALFGLSIRTQNVSTERLVKSWTIRGTMHLFSSDDLPLFLHEGRTHFLRPVDTLEADNRVSAARKAYFADLIVDAVAQGTEEREALKSLCRTSGMTLAEEESLFDPWGGIIRALCETGRLCHRAQEKKAYQLCPAFVPMEKEAAQLELLRRYLAHFGPATIKDAAYFFGTTQAAIKPLLQKLPVTETAIEGRTFYLPDRAAPSAQMPACLFLSGFDQLMLGYEKKQSLFLPQEHVGEIFTRAGIVRPAILVHGVVRGWWKRSQNKLTIALWEDADRALVQQTAQIRFPDVRRIEFL